RTSCPGTEKTCAGKTGGPREKFLPGPRERQNFLLSGPFRRHIHGAASDRAARDPLAPRHVPAVEAVVRRHRAVGRVLHDHDVPYEGVVEEPLAGRAAPGAPHVRQPDAAVTGALPAERRVALVVPVVAVDEG